MGMGIANPRSSREPEMGEDKAGDDKTVSSVSDKRPPSRDAAKLLEISASETKA